MRRFCLTLTFLSAFLSFSIAQKQYQLKSPNGKLELSIEAGDKICYSLKHENTAIIVSSPISMSLSNNKILGVKSKVKNVRRRVVDENITTAIYKRSEIRNRCNELSLTFRDGFQLEFRAYDEGVAYRFIVTENKPFNVIAEEATFNFDDDYMTYIPYVRGGKNKKVEAQFFNSFENVYTHVNLSEMGTNQLAFTPVVVELKDGKKLCIAESDVESYPGMFVRNANQSNSLKGVFAPYPKETIQGGHNKLQKLVTAREDYIAKCSGRRSFPWRIAIVSSDDKELLDNDMVYKLAAPSRLEDTSWIKPGKVAWEWWNSCGLSGVDFKAGVNNVTYKAYIDFASSKGIEYVILDEGWAVNLQADLMQVVKEINLKELVDYAASKNVGIILWAGYYAFERDMENVCRHYADMGVKGFKVDFMDRDDQLMTAFNYRAAEMCAKYKLILDLHGTHKPAGLNRTYPNVLNFEGVNGLEQMKWSPASVDQVKYDVMIPFTRQVSGPMDYTQGAMRNASKGNYYPCNSEPMSQGTRCRQLALYVVFESPFNMLCDTPSNYMREPESTEFIADVPTVWDESIVLDGKMGEYIVTARRSGNVWYVGGITNWTARDVEVDCSFLGDKTYDVTLFKDGMNAHRVGRDYKCESFRIKNDSKLKIHLAPGGGFALKIK